MDLSIKSLSVLSLALMPAFIFSAHASEPVVVEKNYQLGSIKKLNLAFKHAEISVVHTSSNEISVSHVQTLIAGKPEHCFYQLRDKQQHDSLRIYNQKSDKENTWFSNNHCKLKQEISVKIGRAALGKFAFEAQHSQASIDDLDYKSVQFEVAHSKLNIENIKAEKLNTESAHAKVNIAQVEAVKSKIESTHGEVSIEKLIGMNLNGEANHSKVTIAVSEIENIDYDLGHSKLKLPEHIGDQLAIESTHSQVVVMSKITGDVSIENSHGSVDFVGMPKQLSVDNGHGGVKVTQLAADEGDDEFTIKVKNKHGNIRLRLPENSQYNYQLNNDEKVTDKNSNNSVNIRSSYGTVDVFEG